MEYLRYHQPSHANVQYLQLNHNLATALKTQRLEVQEYDEFMNLHLTMAEPTQLYSSYISLEYELSTKTFTFTNLNYF